ncbi:hypothetical protein AAMO2058_000513400 [Amorphochlora amoebiformis]
MGAELLLGAWERERGENGPMNCEEYKGLDASRGRRVTSLLGPPLPPTLVFNICGLNYPKLSVPRRPKSSSEDPSGMLGICVLLAAWQSNAVRKSGVVGGLESPADLEESSLESHGIFLNKSRSGIAIAIDESDSPSLPVMLRGSLRKDIATYIITMPERKKFMMKNFKTMGIEYEDSIFEALGPKTVDMDHYKKTKECREECHRMSDGEVGCALSHVAILRDFLTQNHSRYCMIFEDDALVNPIVFDFFTQSGDKSMKEVLTKLVDTYDKWEWDQLNLGGCWGSCSHRKYLKIPMPEPVKIVSETYSFCTSAYMVTRKAAKMILAEVKQSGLQIADHGVRRSKSFKQVSLEPRLFDQDGGNTPAIHKKNGLKTPEYMYSSCMPPNLKAIVGHH